MKAMTLIGTSLTAGLLAGVATAQNQTNPMTVAEAAQMAVEAAKRAQDMVNEAVPKGAVMAFNLSACPTGWSELAMASGRVVLGAGKGNRDANDAPLSARNLGEAGGEERHVLSIAEIPSHNHTNGDFQYVLMSDGNWTTKAGDYTAGEPNLIRIAPLAATGGGQAHNIMPPFIVLKYCERS